MFRIKRKRERGRLSMDAKGFRNAIRRADKTNELLVGRYKNKDKDGKVVKHMAILQPMLLSKSQEYIKYGLFRSEYNTFVSEVVSIDTFNDKYEIVDVFKGTKQQGVK